MRLEIRRILLVGIAVEILAILTLVVLVAVLGPSDPAAARAYAERLGYWLGPIAGFVLCLLGGWLVARPIPSYQTVNGLALGAFVAAIDVALLLAGGAAFRVVFVVSNVGRLVAGALGGWLASRSDPEADSPARA
jgi:hypothetical protein